MSFISILQSQSTQTVLLIVFGLCGIFFTFVAAFTWRALRSGEIDLSDPQWVATLVWWRSASWIGLVATFGLTAVVVFGGVW